MGSQDLAQSMRVQLEGLSEVLGGSWALVERHTGSDLVVATDEKLRAALIGPDRDVVIDGASRGGIVLQSGLGRRCHPAGRQRGGEHDPSGAPVGLSAPDRILVGVDLAAGPPRETEVALLEVLLRSLDAVAEAGARIETERRRALRLELHATTDPLTGLLNRRGWDRLMTVEEDRCARHGLTAELVVIDLDGLKAINDTLGHEAGDAVIMRAAAFIFSALRSHDSVARLGGDEFAVLAVAAPAGANPVAQRIEHAMAEAGVAASIGSANRAEAGDLARAWRAADVRMYRVKQSHRPARGGARQSGTQPLS